MDIDIPPDVPELVARTRREVLARRGQVAAVETKKARAAAFERADAFEVARRTLAFARGLASALALPPDGLEIFVARRERSVTRVRVRPDGGLSVQHLVPPFGGFHVRATRESDLLDHTPADFNHALARAIDRGDVWQHVREHSY